MKLKKKFLVKLAATLLAIPLILYGGIFLYFYFEKEAPLLTYHINYETDSNRSPAEFAKDADGKRVYLSESPDDLEQEQDTEAVACWDCYEEAWTKSLRNTLAGWLPSSMRTKKQENGVITCGRGAAQAGIDIGAGIVLIVGGGAAYVIEAFSPSKTELRKHRWDQTKYAFYFVVDGKLINVVSNSVKKLAKHLAKSFKEGDAYAICEATTVVASVVLGPKVKANYKADGIKMRDNSIAKAQNKMDDIDDTIKKITKESNDIDLSLKTAKAELQAVLKNTDSKTASAVNNPVLTKKISDLEKKSAKLFKTLRKTKAAKLDHEVFSKVRVADLRKSIVDYKNKIRLYERELGATNQQIKNLNKTEVSKSALPLDMQKSHLLSLQNIQKNNISSSREFLASLQKWVKKEERSFTITTKIKQIAKSPIYLAKAAGDSIPLKANKIAIKWSKTKSGTLAAAYPTGRDARKSKPETLQDYLDSLPQTSP